METLTQTAANGVESLFSVGPIVTLLVLVIMVQVYFIRALLIDAREERRLNREALTGNTAVLARLEELIRVTVSK